MTSVHALRSRHFGLNYLLKKIQKVFCHRQRHPNAANYSSLGNSISVSREVSKAEMYLSVPNPHLGKQISADRLNILSANNIDRSFTERNRFSGRAFSHRQVLLFVNENGEAYDIGGRKWSRS